MRGWGFSLPKHSREREKIFKLYVYIAFLGIEKGKGVWDGWIYK